MNIAEIFGPVFQGEGEYIGAPTVFVRTAGCDFRCSWCDSLHAVLPEHRHTWHTLTPAEILDQVEALTHNQPILITLSGGNPAIQPQMPALISQAHKRGHTLLMETQGTVALPWMTALDFIVISPKPPSSGMRMDPAKVADLVTLMGPRCHLKYVIMDAQDLTWTFAFHAALREALPSPPRVTLQVGNPYPPPGSTDPNGPFSDRTQEPATFLRDALLYDLQALQEQVLEMGWYEARVLPQLHVLLYGNERMR